MAAACHKKSQGQHTTVLPRPRPSATPATAALYAHKLKHSLAFSGAELLLVFEEALLDNVSLHAYNAWGHLKRIFSLGRYLR